MRRIKDENLAELLMQLRYTPEGKRHKQVDALETLMNIIDPAKAYPFEFVHYRITGFHLKRSIEPYTLAGDELLDDLQVFLTKLSTKTAQHVADLGEQVYTVDDLAQAWGISTKTVNRWRKRGLVARKFVFPDGVKRLGMQQSSVDHFFSTHPDIVSRARDFRRLTQTQMDRIIAVARDLAQEDLSRHQVIARVAQETNRAHETIRYTLLSYEEKHPTQPLFARPSGIISPSQASRLYDMYLQKVPIAELMRQFNRSRSSVYRIINQRRATALMARRIRFVSSPEFEDPQQRQEILNETLELYEGMGTRSFESFEIQGEQLLPEYLQILKDTPVLKGELELKLFRRYNCLKYMAYTTRTRISLSRVSSGLLKQAEAYLQEAEEIERLIIEANLRLVVSIASRHSFRGAGFADLVSKGNYALIRAVQEFDYSMGVRFGKRAALSIAKEYAKVSGKSTELSKTRAESIGNIQRRLRETADIAAIERTRHGLTQMIRSELDQREQYVILHHFGLVGSGVKKESKTLNEIGNSLGLTKERIRQIELKALQKLRHCLSSEEFDLLTG
jgi:RNA polymerase sigma factor (sigma-70 family)